MDTERYEALYEVLIEGLLDSHYAVLDGFFDVPILEGLRQELLIKLEQEELRRAGIGNQAKLMQDASIRTDKIRWIEKETQQAQEQHFLRQIQHFSDYLNRTCYTGIGDQEFHYACYEQGTFYRRHLDRFKNDNRRKFSIITYLNEHWQAEHGGALMLYLPKKRVEVTPIWGRTIIFKSDLIEHEVLLSQKRRLSITGWLK